MIGFHKSPKWQPGSFCHHPGDKLSHGVVKQDNVSLLTRSVINDFHQPRGKNDGNASLSRDFANILVIDAFIAPQQLNIQ
jgi:hypothetical protein